jgi:uncharacterized protein (DUF885 family)
VTTRTIDALCDQFVEDYAALDPISATMIGVAGHDDRLTDLSPAGYDARIALLRAAVEAVEAAIPVDDREAAARDSFLERNRLELELEAAGLSRSRMSVLWSRLHQIREVFDLMPTDGEEALADIRARLAAVPTALEGLRVTLCDEARKGNVAAARQYAEVAEQVRRWTGQTGEGGDFFAGSSSD